MRGPLFKASMLAALPLLCAGAAAQSSSRPSPGHDTVVGRMAAPRSGAPELARTGSAKADYILHCAGCHGLDGAGSTQGQVPDLRRLGAFLQLPGGREFVIKVPGVMGSGLDDAQVAGVTNWLLDTLARASVPAGHRPFETSEVTRARAQPLTDVAAERQRLVQQSRSSGVALY
jgi:mono/diheme cytochrome c family protein